MMRSHWCANTGILLLAAGSNPDGWKNSFVSLHPLIHPSIRPTNHWRRSAACLPSLAAPQTEMVLGLKDTLSFGEAVSQSIRSSHEKDSDANDAFSPSVRRDWNDETPFSGTWWHLLLLTLLYIKIKPLISFFFSSSLYVQRRHFHRFALSLELF